MDIQPQGFLHNKLDVKVLILFILARIPAPLTCQEIYEVAYQDESLNYFTFAESLPELVDSGHLQANEQQQYVITDKGRQQGAEVEDSLAVPVVQKVSSAITKKLDQLRRESSILTSVVQDENGYWVTTLHYQDGKRPLMTLSLMAPNQKLGEAMAKNLRRYAEALYKANLDAAIESDGSRREF